MSKKRREVILDSSWPPMIMLIGIGIMFYSYPFEEMIFKYFGESRLFILIPIGLYLFSIYKDHKRNIEAIILMVLAVASISVLSAIIGNGGTLYDSGIFGHWVLNQIISLNGCVEMGIFQNGRNLFDCSQSKIPNDMIIGIIVITVSICIYKLFIGRK